MRECLENENETEHLLVLDVVKGWFCSSKVVVAGGRWQTTANEHSFILAVMLSW